MFYFDAGSYDGVVLQAVIAESLFLSFLLKQFPTIDGVSESKNNKDRAQIGNLFGSTLPFLSGPVANVPRFNVESLLSFVGT